MEEMGAIDPKGGLDFDPETVAAFQVAAKGVGKPAELYRQLLQLVGDDIDVVAFDAKSAPDVAVAAYAAKYVDKAADGDRGDQWGS